VADGVDATVLGMQVAFVDTPRDRGVIESARSELVDVDAPVLQRGPPRDPQVGGCSGLRSRSDRNPAHPLATRRHGPQRGALTVTELRAFATNHARSASDFDVTRLGAKTREASGSSAARTL